MMALSGRKTLEKENVTHVLSVMNDLPTDRYSSVVKDPLEGFKHLKLDILDVEDENIMQYFPQTNAFIQEAVDNGTSVLVHCIAGVSRSVTVTCAYLMKTNNWTADEALKLVRSKRSIARPNESFFSQLQIYHSCKFQVSDDSPLYRQFILRLQANDFSYSGFDAGKVIYTSERAKQARSKSWRSILPTVISELGIRGVDPAEFGLIGSDDQEVDLDGHCDPSAIVRLRRRNAQSTASDIIVPESLIIEAVPRPGRGSQLRCKKCAAPLALSEAFIRHEASSTKTANFAPRNGIMSSLPSQCSQYFVEPVNWMKLELERGELEGKLSCPKCQSKLGSYHWQGNKCSCGHWVVPAIQVQRSRVDEVPIRHKPAL
jgi:dual specificity phosphatase 12